MAFVSGPRQVGKTTTCKGAASDVRYFNWDDEADRRLIVSGARNVVEHLELARLGKGKRVVVFDELHKYSRWKTFLKGLFDKHADALSIVVTGSARLDVYRRGGDSLMGRYFLYRMHPLSEGELLRPQAPSTPVATPRRLSPAKLRNLWTYGGFPEPYSRADKRFSTRWQSLRTEQLVREDLRDLTRIQELDQLEVLVKVLQASSSMQVSYSALAQQVNVSVDTARRWIATLTSLHHGFLVRPWFRNVKKSLRKEPKYYLRDWSRVDDPGARAETYVACHLYKAAQMWQDSGFGTFELHYLRDKNKREVDFVVVRDDEPWFLVEVKASDSTLSPSLGYFQQQLSAPHAFQVVMDLPYVDEDAFSREQPTIVPARTLLSQLP